MITGQWLAEATKKLDEVGIGSARLDALLMLEDELGKDRGWILAHLELVLDRQQLNKLNRQVTKRSRHVPMAQIRGFSEFYGRRFLINKYVLEPRPESEAMIELLKKDVLPQWQSQRLDGAQGADEQRTEPYLRYSERAAEPATPRSAKNASRAAGSAGRQAGAALAIADVGTGSGALGITAALELPTATVDLYDIDSDCLAVAKHNCTVHELHLQARKRDLLSRPLRHYDVVLANLPYVPTNWMTSPSIKMEPRLAIDGGKDGLDHYRRLFAQAARQQMPPGFVITEALPPQHEVLAQIASQQGYRLTAGQDFIQVFAS